MPRRLLLAALAAALLLPTTATAAKTPVPYADESGYPAAVKLAVRQWSKATTQIKLVPTTDPDTVVVPIDSQATLTGDNAALGGALGVQVNRKLFDSYTLPQQTAVLSHVIGHALRMPHSSNPCSIMSERLHTATLDPACRPARFPVGAGRFRCGPNRADARALAGRYGGRATRRTGFCTLPPGTVGAAPSNQRVTLTGGAKDTIDVTNTGTVAVDAGLLAGVTFVPGTLLAPGAKSTVSFGLCLPLTSGRLYSPSFDLFLSEPFQIPTPC